MVADALADQFRAIAAERIARVDAAWTQVVRTLDDAASSVIQREVHTLKGESRVVGFADVNAVAHKLEDLLDLARSRGYAVDDELDLAVAMALQFLAVLVRPRVGAVDAIAFVGHLDRILRRHDHPGRNRHASLTPVLRAVTGARGSAALRMQIGPAAVDAFIEYAVAAGVKRDRLRRSWHALRDLVGVQRAVVTTEQLAKYQHSAITLAHELGKQANLRFEVATAEVTSEVLRAIDLATLHLVRNAVDHGIPGPAAGLPGEGTIRVRGRLINGAYVLVVEDDGQGIDAERVRQRAIELGLHPAGAELTHDRMIDLVCHPGFSTRTETSELSGRGIGLDAVRGAAVDLGGMVTATTGRGRGTAWTVTLPVEALTVEGHAIRAPGLRFPVVLGADWKIVRGIPAVVVDLAAALGMQPSNSISSTVWNFSNGAIEVGLLSGEKPRPVQARRLIATPPTALAEVATVDSIEGLVIRPERIPGVG